MDPHAPLWEEAALLIKTHFNLNDMSFEDPALLGLAMPSKNQGQPIFFHRLNWAVMRPSKILKDRWWKLAIHPTMSGNSFTKAELLHLGSVFSNPMDGLGNQPIIFLCMFRSPNFLFSRLKHLPTIQVPGSLKLQDCLQHFLEFSNLLGYIVVSHYGSWKSFPRP